MGKVLAPFCRVQLLISCAIAAGLPSRNTGMRTRHSSYREGLSELRMLRDIVGPIRPESLLNLP